MAAQSTGALGSVDRREIWVLNMRAWNDVLAMTLRLRGGLQAWPRIRRVPCLALLALVALTTVPRGGAENLFGVGGNLQVAGFVSRGLDSAGRTEWELRGEKAQIRGQSTELSDYKIVFKGKDGDDFTLSSPRCRYLHSAAEVKSDAPVFVEGRGVQISGIGYDVYLDAKVVMIRSTVTMKIKQRQGSLRKSLQRVTADEKKPAATSDEK